jgi:hypothetical protein
MSWIIRLGTASDCMRQTSLKKDMIRAADAKEVGVGNPAEETCCYPNQNECNNCVTHVNRLVAGKNT